MVTNVIVALATSLFWILVMVYKNGKLSQKIAAKIDATTTKVDNLDTNLNNHVADIKATISNVKKDLNA